MSVQNKVANLIEKFNGKCKTLTFAMANKFADDPETWEMKRRIFICFREFPTYPIDELGKIMYHYKVPILTHDDEFFMHSDFSDVLEENKECERMDEILYMIPRLRPLLMDEDTAGEKEEMWKIVIDMLNIYIDYMFLTAN
jgi:hypothetical protein